MRIWNIEDEFENLLPRVTALETSVKTLNEDLGRLNTKVNTLDSFVNAIEISLSETIQFTVVLDQKIDLSFRLIQLLQIEVDLHSHELSEHGNKIQDLEFWLLQYYMELLGRILFESTRIDDLSNRTGQLENSIIPLQHKTTNISFDAPSNTTTISGILKSTSFDIPALDINNILFRGSISIGAPWGIFNVLSVNDFFQPPSTGRTWPAILTIKNDGVTELGRHLDFHMDSASTRDYIWRITLPNQEQF
jgi:hypothetical protein